MEPRTNLSITLLLCLTLLGFSALAQNPSANPKPSKPLSKSQLEIAKVQDTIQALSDSMLDSENLETRITSAYAIIPRLVRMLQKDIEIKEEFDSLKRISILKSPDSKIRVITWQLNLSNGRARHFGAIQRKNKDSLEIYPLFDASDFLTSASIQDTILDNNSWIGALYYNIIQREVGGKPYYFLFGFDQKDGGSNIKLIEALHFVEDEESEEMKVVLGAPLFLHGRQGEVDENKFYEKPKTKNFQPKPAARMILEYFEPAMLTLNWDQDKNLIVFDEIEPLNDYSWDIFATYVPSGKYKGLQFVNEKWQLTDRVFDYVSPEAPMPMPKSTESLQILIPKDIK